MLRWAGSTPPCGGAGPSMLLPFFLAMGIGFDPTPVLGSFEMSAALRFSPGDLNDMLATAQDCILPLRGTIQPKGKTKGKAGSASSPIMSKRTGEKGKKRRKPAQQQQQYQEHEAPAYPAPSEGHFSKDGESNGITETAEKDIVELCVETPAAGVENAEQAKDVNDTNREAIIATVALSDCLSCSGCVTSAEEILLDRHSAHLLLNMSADPSLAVAVSLSPQACSSIAEASGISVRDASRRLSTFLRSLGVRYVMGTSTSNEMALRLACEEFELRWYADKNESQGGTSTRALPVLCSECPGITVYLEKTQTKQIVSLLSKVKSPQAIQSTVLKRLLEPRLIMGGTCRKVWHCTVMPCLDKKLESARPELSAPGAPPETDCVLTASELMQLIKERGVSLNSLAPSSLDSLSSLLSSDVVTSSGCSESSIGGGKEGMQRSLDLEVAPGGCSGGYLDRIARSAAKSMMGLTLPSELTFQAPKKSQDLLELTISKPGEGGSVRELRFAKVYGFRHMQNLLSSIKDASCSYDYVEVMSCPGGCNNGGGQVRVDKVAAGEQLGSVNRCYDEAGMLSDATAMDAEATLQALRQSGEGCRVLRTKFRVKEMPIQAQIKEW